MKSKLIFIFSDFNSTLGPPLGTEWKIHLWATLKSDRSGRYAQQLYT